MSKILLSREAYRSNLTSIATKVGGFEKIWLILKDNAYGHGALHIAQMAREMGVRFCVVKSEVEAREVAEFFEESLVLSHIANGNEDGSFLYAVNSLKDLERIKSGTRVHVACDSGMHRNGLVLDELARAVELAKSRGVQICGAFTHFKDADETEGEFEEQTANWGEFKRTLVNLLGSNLLFHSCNSAALERTSEFGEESVRVGIAQFGYAQFGGVFNLRPVLSLWASRVSSRILKAGQSVGYGGAFVAPKEMRVAVYDLGYGDGLLRFGGRGELLLANGKSLLGKMSMDSFVSEDVGEEVCVFDDARIWAKFFSTIEYDILVKLSKNIERIVL